MRNVSNAIIGPMLPLLLLAGCSAKITSSLAVGAKPFQPTSCSSGQPNGFAGVDLMDGSGARLRLVSLPNGQAAALLFAPGASQATELGACGPFTLERQSSRINGVYNLRGTATLGCKGKTPVVGSVQFENCH
jgi:hypothetical protein